MKLVALRIEGFGRLTERAFTFDPGFNVVYGPNEAGKSTLTNAILALLYGFPRGERDAWRPWSGARYAATLSYVLSDGRVFEVQRDFEREPKGVRVYDESGNDVSSEAVVGRTVIPGQTHLQIPLEVFVNASFLAQGEARIDGARAERISSALAQALDGGPREDAALGALRRLDAALAQHVGTKRATVNAPLKRLREECDEIGARATAMRQRLAELESVRARLQTQTRRSVELESTLREHERRAKALRAQSLRARLGALGDIRDELALLQAKRAEYDDVEGFPAEAVAELERRYRDWYAGSKLAEAAARDALEARMTPIFASELEERLAQGGAMDDASFAELEGCAAEAVEARSKAVFAANEAQRARRAVDGGSELFGAAFASGAFITAAAGVLGVAHVWTFAALAAALAIAIFAFAGSRWASRREAQRRIARMQSAADDAAALEARSAEMLATALGPLGLNSIEELARNRHRAAELTARKEDAQRAAARARHERARADLDGDAFDALAQRLVEPSGSRERDLAAAKAREVRRIARDGAELQLSMLDVRRGDVLAGDDEYSLEAELDELLAAGISPSGLEPGTSARAFAAEGADIERRLGESRTAVAALAAELRTSEGQVGDLAAVDEQLAQKLHEAAKLERFEAAVTLAHRTIEERTREAHQKFARRLGDYASRTFCEVTNGRYIEVRIDPTTLAVRVRVPESGAIVEVDHLSAGTREQAFLVVRLAMARMFAEGIETPPLLLDDPFTYWDEARSENSLPILEAIAREAQTFVFTTSRELVAASQARGARIIELRSAAVPVDGYAAVGGDADPKTMPSFETSGAPTAPR
jgi:uncharacterized protein YhaN